MHKNATLVAAALIVLALFLAVPAWPGTIPASLVPEGARWIAHLDMEKFVATDLYGYLEKDGRFQIKGRDIDRWLKMDLAKDIKGVTVIGLGPDDANIVFVVEGTLDKAGIIALVALDKEHQETPYGAYTLYSSGSDEYGAFVNDNLLVFSERRAAIEKVLDVAAGKAKTFAGTKLAASLKDVPAGAFLSGVIDDLSGLGKEISQSKLIEKASGLFFLAQEKQSRLQLRLQMNADTPENAKNIADLVQGVMALGRMSGGEGDMAGLAALVDGIQVKLDGKTVRLEFDGASQDVAKLLSHRNGFPHLLD
jgi:hypothetical protein